MVLAAIGHTGIDWIAFAASLVFALALGAGGGAMVGWMVLRKVDARFDEAFAEDPERVFDVDTNGPFGQR
jgi:hypothetical protein